MNILESSSYILGKKYIDKLSKEPYRADENTLKDAAEIFSLSPTNKVNLEGTDSASVFYSNEKDLAHKIPSEKREEYFYAMKLEMCSPVVPAKCIFLLKKCLEDTGSLNNMCKVLPKKDMENMFSEGYLVQGYTLLDIIVKLIQKDYKPMRKGSYKVKINDYYEIYIECKDRIGFLPEAIGESLSDEDIRNIVIDSMTMKVNNRVIAELGGRLGVTSKVYDLRDII